MTPGPVTIGPQDPDSASDLTARLGVHNKADKLLARARANYPEALTRALSLPDNPERTAALDLEEVESAVRSIEGRRAFVKDDDKVIDARVKGREEDELVVAVLYERPSGRTARGVIPYEGLRGSARRFAEQQEEESSSVVGSTRQASSAGARDAAEEKLREYEERLQQLDSQLREREERLASAEDPEPWQGYNELNAKERAEKVRDGGLEEFGRAGLERIRTYEETHQKSKQVLSAVDDALAQPRGE